MGESPELMVAIRKFVEGNCGFESSAVTEAAMELVAAAGSLTEAFLAPVRHKVFGFATAQLYAFFLHGAPHVLAAHDIDFGAMGVAPLDLAAAYGHLEAIFDRVTAELVETCWEGDDSDEDDADDADGADDAE